MQVLVNTRGSLQVLFTGRRGPEGPPGEQGEPGDRGPGITPIGVWSSGESYGPGDAVTGDSSAAQGISSLFVQYDSVVESVSTTPPRDAPSRWLEVGPSDLSNVTGAIWSVVQSLHGFTAIGQPVGYSVAFDRWILTTNKIGDDSPVAVVRDIISVNEVILQTVGQITNLNPAVIYPPGATSFIPGRFYYASHVQGFLTLTPTVESTNYASQAMLIATDAFDGVVLNWQNTPNVSGLRPVGYTSYFYTATAGQTVFSGADLDANVLTYIVSDQTRVIQNGLDLSSRDQFTAATGTSVTLTTPAALNDDIEIRVLAEPLEAIAPATSSALDNITPLFNGVQTRFPLTVGGGGPLALALPTNILIWLDGNTQEAIVDFNTIVGLVQPMDIVFTAAPATATRFWGLAGVAISSLALMEVDTLIADVATIGNLNFTTGVGGNLDLTNLDADDIDVVDLTATTVAITTLGVTTLTVGTLNVTVDLNTARVDSSGPIEGTGLRAATIQGPTAGGQIVATDITIDEGTF